MRRSLGRKPENLAPKDEKKVKSSIVILAKVWVQAEFRHTPNDSILCAACDSVVRNLFIRIALVAEYLE